LKAATGSEQQTVVRHDLLLQSSYAQIEVILFNLLSVGTK
jgi:hypothetical protein